MGKAILVRKGLFRLTVLEAHSPRPHLTMVRKSWWQEVEAGGHIACRVRKQRMMGACVQLPFSFLFSPGPQPIAWRYPQWADLPTTTSLIKIILHWLTQRLYSTAILGLIQLTIQINCHSIQENMEVEYTNMNNSYGKYG